MPKTTANSERTAPLGAVIKRGTLEVLKKILAEPFPAALHPEVVGEIDRWAGARLCLAAFLKASASGRQR
jgi:hypothetical protein